MTAEAIPSDELTDAQFARHMRELRGETVEPLVPRAEPESIEKQAADLLLKGKVVLFMVQRQDEVRGYRDRVKVNVPAGHVHLERGYRQACPARCD